MSKTPTRGGIGGLGGLKPPGTGNLPSTIKQANVPTTLKRGTSLTSEGLQAAGKQMVSDQQRNQTLDWLKKVNGGMVSFLLDKSSSMTFIKKLVIEGYNDYLNALRKYPNIGFSLYQFDTESFETTYELRAVQYVPMLTDATYRPLGGTPLYDSIIETIHRADKAVDEGRIAANRVIITTMSDGGDSTGKSPDEVRSLIADRQQRGYQFQFLGMGFDGYQLGNLMGIPPQSTMSFDSDHAGNAFEALARSQTEYLQGKAKDTAFTKEERRLADDKHAPKLLK